MNVLLLSMPDSFEHMSPITVRMPSGALGRVLSGALRHAGSESPGNGNEPCGRVKVSVYRHLRGEKRERRRWPLLLARRGVRCGSDHENAGGAWGRCAGENARWTIPEVYLNDPDGIQVQLQDVSYCGGMGVLGSQWG